jgi:hypothetical protein
MSKKPKPQPGFKKEEKKLDEQKGVKKPGKEKPRK